MTTDRRAPGWVARIARAVLLLVLLAAVSGLASPRPAACSDLATASPAVAYFDVRPLAVRVGSTAPVEFRFQVSGSPSAVQLILEDGSAVPLAQPAPGTYAATLTAAQALAGYRTSEPYNDHNHNHVGWLDLYEGATLAVRCGLFVNVIDERVPAVTVRSRAADVQTSPRVANVVVPGMNPASPDARTATQRFYHVLGDDYDLANVLFVPQRFANRTHVVIRNQVQGIGLPNIDAGASYGSPSRLIGVTHYPLLSYFDLAETASVHEIGHQWINHLDGPAVVANPGAHWPLSSLAQGLMGVSGPAESGYQGLSFPYALTPVPGGNYHVVYVGPYRTFTDMDLYLMGMLPAAAVGTHFVFNNQSQTATHGGTLLGPVTWVTAQSVIQANGARNPAYPNARTRFRVATIVMSNRLLTPDEMAFLDYFAARGSLTMAVPFSSGLSAGVTYPFYVATRGSGCLVTTLDHDGSCNRAFLPAVRR